MDCIYSHLGKYIKYTPTFRYVRSFLFNKKIVIDHVAHRTFNYDNLKLHYMNNKFDLKKDKYIFENMNVEATWLKSNCFRVFLSQYRGLNNFKINNFEEYKKLQKENDYVAWTLLHKDDINHVAIQVEDIEDIIKRIRQDGTIMLNNENNPIEISRDGKLLQASTVADKISYKFEDGNVHLVPYTFVEFIQRIDGREGFETRNAARIFTSTNL